MFTRSSEQRKRKILEWRENSNNNNGQAESDDDDDDDVGTNAKMLQQQQRRRRQHMRYANDRVVVSFRSLCASPAFCAVLIRLAVAARRRKVALVYSGIGYADMC